MGNFLDKACECKNPVLKETLSSLGGNKIVHRICKCGGVIKC